MASAETIIDLIRHGEPVGGHKLRGSQDDLLSELGWQQMRESVGQYSHWNTRVVYRHFSDGGKTAQLKFHQAAFPKHAP